MILDPNKPVIALILNNMRGNTEDRALVAWSQDEEALRRFEAQERVPAYHDPGICAFSGGEKTFVKVYKKDGPLEWFNAADDPIYLTQPDGGFVVLHHPQRVITDALDRYAQWLNQGVGIP